MKDTLVVQDQFGRHKILASDLASALQLSKNKIAEMVKQLDQYNLGGLTEIESEFGEQSAIYISGLDSGSDLWIELAKFFEITSQSLSVFAIDMDFARLDA
jgi:hypothetical protein